MTEETRQRVQKVKCELRSFMNGPVSQSLRQKGLGYRIIFGVEWPRLLEMAKSWGKDAELAQALWKEDIRECRLLAGAIMPPESFPADLADEWVNSMRWPEEAQFTVLSLLQYEPYASERSFRWIASPSDMTQLCGWLLLTRLFMRGNRLMDRSENEFADQAETALSSPVSAIRGATRNAVLHYARIGERESQRMAKLLSLCGYENTNSNLN